MSDSASAVDSFRNDAAAYCDFIDALRTGTVAEPYPQLLQLLSNLAKSGVALPFDMAKGKVENKGMDHSQWQQVSSEIAAAIAPAIAALLTEHDDDQESLVRAYMLDDDLSDIYRDIRQGLNLYAVDDPEHRAEAVWQWRFGYENHWGAHLFRALTTVHEVRYRLYMK